MVALLIPATSASDTSISSVSNPRRSPHRRYIRNSISAQSCASVPPEPAWMSRNALEGSISPGNMRRNSRAPRRSSSAATSASTSATVAVSDSSSAIARRASASSSPASRRSNPSTTSASRARSRPSACARSGSLQTSGNSSSRSTSSSFSRRVPMSKIPPQGIETPSHVLDASMDCVGFFHGETLREWRSTVALRARLRTRRRMVLQRPRPRVPHVPGGGTAPTAGEA